MHAYALGTVRMGLEWADWSEKQHAGSTDCLVGIIKDDMRKPLFIRYYKKLRGRSTGGYLKRALSA